MSPPSILFVIGTTTLCAWLWFLLYLKLKSKYNLDGEFTTRIIAAAHAVLVVFLCYFALKHGPDPLAEPGEPNTGLQVFTMIISLGYFMYDFVWCIKFQPEVKLILLHHFGSICSLTFIITCGCSGAEAIGGLGSMEMTNPLLQARWFLRTFDKKETVLFQVVEYSFFALFLSVRLGYGSYLLYAILNSERTYYTVKFCTILMYVVSLAFVHSIVTFILKRINDRSRSLDDDVKLS